MILLAVLRAVIAVVADTEVQHSARSLDICVSLACKPNVYGSLWCGGRGGVRVRLKRSAPLSLSKH